MLPKEAIAEYQQIFFEVYKKSISFQIAEEQANRLFNLLKIIIKPKAKKITNI